MEYRGYEIIGVGNVVQYSSLDDYGEIDSLLDWQGDGSPFHAFVARNHLLDDLYDLPQAGSLEQLKAAIDQQILGV